MYNVVEVADSSVEGEDASLVLRVGYVAEPDDGEAVEVFDVAVPDVVSG